MNNVNLQIYSFGFDCGLSFLDKIRKAGELGYAGVELVRDYEGIPAQDVVNALKEAGIPAVSAHVGLDFIEQDLPYLAELGVKYVACPMAAFNTAEEAKELAADLNRLWASWPRSTASPLATTTTQASSTWTRASTCWTG